VTTRRIPGSYDPREELERLLHESAALRKRSEQLDAAVQELRERIGNGSKPPGERRKKPRPKGK
jgi:predicted nuclease with TOPRIM domain